MNISQISPQSNQEMVTFSINLHRLMATFHSFYAELYSSEELHNQKACDNFLNNIPLPKLSEEESLRIDTPITLNELKNAALDMCSLGPLFFFLFQGCEYCLYFTFAQKGQGP